MADITTMDARDVRRNGLEDAGPDRWKETVQFPAEALRDAEAEALCGAA